MRNLEKIVTADGVELYASYRVVYQTKRMKRDNPDSGYVLYNPDKTRTGWVMQHTFDHLEDALKALADLIRECNRGARVETQKCGMIGIDFVIDEETAADEAIVSYQIKKQYKTMWETIEEK